MQGHFLPRRPDNRAKFSPSQIGSDLKIQSNQLFFTIGTGKGVERPRFCERRKKTSRKNVDARSYERFTSVRLIDGALCA